MAELLLFIFAGACALSFVSSLVAIWHIVQEDARAAREAECWSKYHKGVQVEKLSPEEAYRRIMK